jgi:hypothetical protein
VSVSYFVRYDIAVSDVTAFLERYRSVHVPLVAAWPGLQRMCRVPDGDMFVSIRQRKLSIVTDTI